MEEIIRAALPRLHAQAERSRLQEGKTTRVSSDITIPTMALSGQLIMPMMMFRFRYVSGRERGRRCQVVADE
jgi:hypothetical protein